ncbi:MAG: GlsB/YeaQ/YmgE family stress response membrane protein [Alphaproteobacteria bacterium]|nr:GlsB/YeaQ/YmgE family stress response membrane protein [Alphaproteobacteria bacterium]
MGIISWIILGLVAKLILPGNDPGGFIVTAIIGIVGGVIGGFVGSLLGLGGVDGLNIGSIVLAIVGAMILLVGYRMVKKNS